MTTETGGVNNFNPNKEISIEIVLNLLLKHRDARYKAELGHEMGETEIISDNTRIANQVSSLREIISSQKLIIDVVAKPIIEENCVKKYQKRYKTVEERGKHPFEKEDNDIKKLLHWRRFLEECRKALKEADLTPSLADDFMTTRISGDGKKENYLTDNFFEMMDDLAESYNQISRLLIQHEITVQKEYEDEEVTGKQAEELFMERFEEA